MGEPELVTDLLRFEFGDQLAKPRESIQTLLKVLHHLFEVLDVGRVHLQVGSLHSDHVGYLSIVLPVPNSIFEIAQKITVKDHQFADVVKDLVEVLRGDDMIERAFRRRGCGREHEFAKDHVDKVESVHEGAF